MQWDRVTIARAFYLGYEANEFDKFFPSNIEVSFALYEFKLKKQYKCVVLGRINRRAKKEFSSG